jgi:biopolymer transport protein ExbB
MFTRVSHRLSSAALVLAAAMFVASPVFAQAEDPVAATTETAAPAATDPATGLPVDGAVPADPNALPVPGATTMDGTVPATDATTTVAPMEESTAEVENPYGLKALWAQGDWVAKGTLIILVIMSAGTWYILFTKYMEQRKIMGQFRTVEKKFWSANSIQEGVSKLEKNSAFRAVAEDGLGAASHHQGKLAGQVGLHEWVSIALSRSTDSVANSLQNGLAFLATVGSTAPFVGLFGTVWGIYHALIAIGIAGQASIDKVAGPVGEALIMTAIGLAVAVPAVLAYNWLVRRNKAVLEQLRAFSGDVETYILGGTHAAKV